jgi:trigger factor
VVKDKKVEKLENSSVKLTVTVSQNAVASEYSDLLKTYAKQAHIKGFRKGKVPPEVLERKFGDSIKYETTQKLLEESLKSVMEEIEEKPLPYSIPEVQDELDLNTEEDFTYSVVYDVYPDIQIEKHTGLEIEAPQVSVSKEDIQRELETLQDQNSMVVEKTSGPVAKDDIVTITYVELDENDEEKEETRRQDFVFTVGSGYNLYKIDDDVIGMQKDEEKVLTKEYSEDEENQELAGRTVKLRVKITNIKEKQLPEIDDELAQDISDQYETLDDLKKDIEKRLKDTADSRVRERKQDRLTEKILEHSTVQIPESMVRAELENSWQNFVRQFRATDEQVLKMLEAQGQTKEAVQEQWREGARDRIRKQLVVHKLIEDLDIEVAEEEVDERIREQAGASNMSFEDAKKYYEDNNMLSYVRHDIEERKLFDKLFEENNVKKGEKLKLMDLLQGNQ